MKEALEGNRKKKASNFSVNKHRSVDSGLRPYILCNFLNLFERGAARAHLERGGAPVLEGVGVHGLPPPAKQTDATAGLVKECRKKRGPFAKKLSKLCSGSNKAKKCEATCELC